MSNNKSLQQSVLAKLSYERSMNAGHIGVTARDGAITLTGRVKNFNKKRAAEKAAGRVKRVKAVAEEIDVKLDSDIRQSYARIATAAVDRLAWDVSVPRDSMKVPVEKGWIILTGYAQGHFQKEAAEHDSRRLLGVTGISNDIKFKPEVRASDIKQKITTARGLSCYDAAMVTVGNTDGYIRLGGSVRNWHERQLAAMAAWGAPGVTSVEDHMHII